MTQILERDPAPAPATPPAPPRPEWRHRLVPAVLMLLGAAVMLYPVGATYYNNLKQFQFASEYGAEVSSAGPVTLEEALERAAAYNASLAPTSMLDPWTAAQAEDNAAYQDYLGQLDLFSAMATLRVPSIGVQLPIYHGTSDTVLSRGVGHLYGSTLPVGGSSTHSVLTAHSAYPDATLFDELPELQIGDTFFIDVYGQTLAYEVDQLKTVLPDELDDLARVDGADLITLVTCTPFAVNSHRLLVRAHAVPYDIASDPTGAERTMDWSIQSWMWPRVIGATIALAILVIIATGWIRGDRRRARNYRATLADDRSAAPPAGPARGGTA
ncbi:MAG: class C sortase [Actinomycetia bacterium]|nr:class C sortase [Actinomycetes bacterium]